MSAANGGEATQGTAATDEKYSGIWGLLPSFDPTTDDPREYKDKVTFLHQICPQKDRSMLAPRLAMQCKGTAWAQVKSLDATTLTDPVNGVKALLLALSSWDEAAELQTYEKFEKALFRVQQRSDETTMSYVNRLAVAFNEIGGELTIKEVKAFIMLKQSALSSEDKRKVITLAGGSMDASKVEQAMRTLSTKILTSHGEAKKKVYPVNYVEEDTEEVHAAEDENLDDEQFLQQLVDQGDEDANFVADYEDQILDMVKWQPGTACERKPAIVASGLPEQKGEKVEKVVERKGDGHPSVELWQNALLPHTAGSAVKKAIGEWSVRKGPVAASRTWARKSATLRRRWTREPTRWRSLWRFRPTLCPWPR